MPFPFVYEEKPMTELSPRIETLWERPALTAGNSDATLMIRITAPQRSPGATATRPAVDLAFAIDRSGSMSGRPLELAKQAVSQAVGMLDRNDRAALIAYDDQIDLVHPLARVDARGRNELRLGLARVDARGSTNLCDGWLTGCRELARHDAAAGTGERIRRSILLTDGLANQGETDPAAIFQHATELRQRGITTTTLGMGQRFDDELLSGMAEAGGGSYVYLESAAQLARTFEREVGRLAATVATRINLRVLFPEGLRGELLNRFPLERTGKRFDIALDDLVAGDEIVLVFAITGHDMRDGERLPFELSLRWTDPFTSDRRTQQAVVMPIEVIDDRLYATMPVVTEVAAQAAILRAAESQRRAMELDRAGRYTESRALHSAAFDVLSAAPLLVEDAHLIDEARAYADQAPHAAFAEHDRKQAAFDAFNRARRRRTANE
jgi:Ca-activated chloride channel family protein